MWSRQSFRASAIWDFESPTNFQVKEKNLFKSVKKQRNYALTKNAKIIIGLLWSRESFEESTISDLGSPSNFQFKEDEKIELGPETMKLYLN